MSEFNCKVAETEAELKDYFAIRHMVFVDEQGMFEETDRDEYDERGIHLIAVDSKTGQVVGAVRCYEAENGIWYGGRLAVHPDYRGGAFGRRLCQLAEATVIEHGCVQFLAYIQLQNVHFFQRLKWSRIGEPVLHHGQPHQLMAASLAAAPHRVVKEHTETHHA